MIAGISCLGQINFSADPVNEKSMITDSTMLFARKAAELLSLNIDELIQAITVRTIQIQSGAWSEEIQ